MRERGRRRKGEERVQKRKEEERGRREREVWRGRKRRRERRGERLFLLWGLIQGQIQIVSRGEILKPVFL